MQAPRPAPSPPIAVRGRRRAWRGLAASFRFAWDGIVDTAVRQRNMRIHVVIALWVGLVGSAVTLTTAERLALVLCIFLVLAAEVANSALEALVDLVTRDRHELARVAKDAGAGAVLILAVGAVAVAGVILVHAGPVLLAARDVLIRLLVLGAPVTVVAVALLVPAHRRRWVDLLLAVAGAALLVPVAARSVSAVFTTIAMLLFAVCVAVAFRRGR